MMGRRHIFDHSNNHSYVVQLWGKESVKVREWELTEIELSDTSAEYKAILLQVWACVW